MSHQQLQADFIVKVGDHEYSIWADGRIEGFGDGKATVTVFNRIPTLIQKAERLAGVAGQDVRMQCVSLAMGHCLKSEDIGVLADLLAQYVLTGKKPGAEG